jgi:hypothetical protein
MGFIGKLLSTVSSIALILSGASAASASKPTPSAPYQGAEQQQLPTVGVDAGELLSGFIVDVGGRYTEDTVEAAVRRMLEGMTPDRVTYLPEFVRGLRGLGLSPEVEVAAVETLISMLEEQAGLLISAERASAVTGEVFDEFVAPYLVAQGGNPTGKFSESLLFPGNPHAFTQGEKKGKPFQPS